MIEIETEIQPQILKKVIKNKSQFYFDETIDNKILEEYNDQTNNIMTISSKNNIKTWEVVSLLMQYKIIERREKSRGYEIYKTTKEYTSKFKSNK